jgi:hypothetical protein
MCRVRQEAGVVFVSFFRLRKFIGIGIANTQFFSTQKIFSLVEKNNFDRLIFLRVVTFSFDCTYWIPIGIMSTTAYEAAHRAVLALPQSFHPLLRSILQPSSCDISIENVVHIHALRQWLYEGYIVDPPRLLQDILAHVKTRLNDKEWMQGVGIFLLARYFCMTASKPISNGARSADIDPKIEESNELQLQRNVVTQCIALLWFIDTARYTNILAAVVATLERRRRQYEILETIGTKICSDLFAFFQDVQFSETAKRVGGREMVSRMWLIFDALTINVKSGWLVDFISRGLFALDAEVASWILYGMTIYAAKTKGTLVSLPLECQMIIETLFLYHIGPNRRLDVEQSFITFVDVIEQFLNRIDPVINIRTDLNILQFFDSLISNVRVGINGLHTLDNSKRIAAIKLGRILLHRLYHWDTLKSRYLRMDDRLHHFGRELQQFLYNTELNTPIRVQCMDEMLNELVGIRISVLSTLQRVIPTKRGPYRIEQVPPREQFPFYQQMLMGSLAKRMPDDLVVYLMQFLYGFSHDASRQRMFVYALQSQLPWLRELFQSLQPSTRSIES